MPIVAADLKIVGSANRPEDDATLTGGGVAAAVRPTLTQWTANAVAAAVSDGADVRTLTVTGRLQASGIVDTEVLNLNGAAEVVGVKVWGSILKAVLSAADGARTVTLRQGAGGATRATLAPNETETTIVYKKAASAPAASKTLYEKAFAKNAHATIALQNGKVKLTADPAAKIEIGVAPAVDDAATVANRTAAPASVTFVDDNVEQSVPGGNIAAGSAIGVWSKLSLAAANAPLKDTFTVQLAGDTIQ